MTIARRSEWTLAAVLALEIIVFSVAAPNFATAGNAAEIVADEFALAGVEAGSHLDPKAVHRITGRAGAADRARRAIEGG